MSKRLLACASVTLLLVALSACDYHPGDLDNPISRKATWFSFLSGDDIRKSCVSGAPDYLRIIYNGRWYEQVRVYQVVGVAPYTLNQRVVGPADLSHFDSSLGSEVLAGRVARTDMGEARYRSLAAAVDAAIAAMPPKVDEIMASDSFYWVVSGCRGGKFVFDAWQFGRPGFDRLGFPDQLLASDQSGVAFNPPHEPDSLDLANKPTADRQRWSLRVYADHVGGGAGF